MKNKRYGLKEGIYKDLRSYASYYDLSVSALIRALIKSFLYNQQFSNGERRPGKLVARFNFIKILDDAEQYDLKG